MRGVIFLLVLSVSTSAAAQTDAELAQARTTFMEGVELTEQERWAEAAERFRAVMEVRATGQVKYNLGLALSHTGELAEAAALLGQAAEDPELDRRTRRAARGLLEEIEPRLATLTVRLRGDEAGVTVTVDGEPWALGRLGPPQRVDPGTHEVASLRGEQTLDSQAVTVEEGGAAEVSLSTQAPVGAIDDELLADAAADEDTGGASVLEQWWLWTAIGAAVVIGVGVTVGVVVATDGSVQPVMGNLDPSVLQVTP